MNRIMLFRQVLRELPEHKDMFLRLLYKGPTRILVRTLELFGWTFTNGALCTHEDGRFFHRFLSPPKQVYSLLCSSWADYVCTQVNHRKGLESLESIDLQLTKGMPTLLLSERGLVLCQQTGALRWLWSVSSRLEETYDLRNVPFVNLCVLPSRA